MLQENDTTYSGQVLARLAQRYGFQSDTPLADRLGVTRQTVSNWRTRDSLDYRLLLEKFPDADLNWLFRGLATEPTGSPITFESAMEYLSMLGWKVTLEKGKD